MATVAVEMCNRADIEREIRAAAEAVVNGVAYKADLVQSLVSTHEMYAGDGETLYALYYSYGEHINRYFRDIKAAEEEIGAPEELLLPGFKRLQRRYVLQRDSQSCIIGIDYMTPEELDAKEKEHRQMAIGHIQHAEEIHSFRVAKFGEPQE